MTACPISKLKYNEKNLDASFFMNESDCDLFKNLNLEKDIDILFFGAFKADRVKYLNKLEKIWLENQKMLICVDSMAGHLSAEIGVPSVTIFGSQNPKLT